MAPGIPSKRDTRLGDASGGRYCTERDGENRYTTAGPCKKLSHQVSHRHSPIRWLCPNIPLSVLQHHLSFFSTIRYQQAPLPMISSVLCETYAIDYLVIVRRSWQAGPSGDTNDTVRVRGLASVNNFIPAGAYSQDIVVWLGQRGMAILTATPRER
jgi:hypothetical protein